MASVSKARDSCCAVSSNRILKQKTRRTTRQILLVGWTVLFAYLSFSETQSAFVAFDVDPNDVYTGKLTSSWAQASRQLLKAGSENDTPIYIPGENCTPAAIDDFPTDLFTQAQRKQGYLLVHFIASIYLFLSLSVVCDDYFVPSIECICEELHLPSDVAGATFMAIATSSPELFTNVIGTFVTEGDIGVGTIVGSAVFNILAVPGICGLVSPMPLPLDWYPLTRDCVVYAIAVVLLITVLVNREVLWYEALVLVIAYIFYIGIMYFNTKLRGGAENMAKSIGSQCCCVKSSKRRKSLMDHLSEKSPLIGSGFKLSMESSTTDLLTDMDNNEEDIPERKLDEILIAKALHKSEAHAEEEKEELGLFQLPHGQSALTVFQWIICWPARFAFTFSVPDCREPHRRKWYPLTFVMCIVWIALLSYLVSWMVTVIGHTLSIPDSIVGLTLLAAGTSIPEIVSSAIVARQGLGTMSISNSIGSNIFDILLCLGLPWLIKTSIIANDPEQNFIQINSGGLEYSAMSLLVSLFLLYVVIAFNGYYLDRKVGFIVLAIYAVFLVLASLFELNVFFKVNDPTCPTSN